MTTDDTRLEEFHRQFLAVDEPTTQRDDTDIVRVHAYIAPVGPRPHDARVGLVVAGFAEPAATGAASRQHDIMRTDPSVGSRQPAHDVGV